MSVLRSVRMAALLWIIAIPATAAAQARPDEALIRRIDSLEQRVLELERRLSRSEAPAAGETSTNRIRPGNPRDIASWRRLRERMTYEEVRAILGEPERVRGGGVAFWTYPRGGEVGFVSGRVSSWKEPDR